MPESLFNLLDCIVLILCLVSSILGFRRRLSGEIANLIGFIFATLVILFFMGAITETLITQTSLSARSAGFAAYLIVFVATILLVYFIAKILGGLMRITVSRGTDHFLGAVAGLLRALIIMYIIILGLLACPVGTVSQNTAVGSFSGALVHRSLPHLMKELEKIQDPATDQPDVDVSPSL